tara:strand:+ start:1366 stop:1743 length:378 start_codon:yes stop_codon:yes gene_type:complete
MAFKMKGSSYKTGGHKTKTTMAYMKSPLEQEMAAATEPVEETEEVVEEKVNPHGDWRTNQQAAIWKAINVGDPKETLANMERHMSAGHYDNMSPKAKNNAQRTINALRGHMESQGDYSWKEGYNF